ncbi:ABEC1 enzyme, partial [Alaudala cheleensis]|nr:ABEC1 enzyme [Alaudala cheleensis]
MKLLFCFSMYISKKALRKHFDPRVYPHETYLLCHLQWGGSDRCWIHWLRNTHDLHAEEFFLEEIFEPRSYNFCTITWYLSYSPCWRCCDAIQDFLERQPNVEINIHVARLFYSDSPENRRALRELHSLPRVNYLASVSLDYSYCWKTFLQRGDNCGISPKGFEFEIQRNRLRLENILMVSTL